MEGVQPTWGAQVARRRTAGPRTFRWQIIWAEPPHLSEGQAEAVPAPYRLPVSRYRAASWCAVPALCSASRHVRGAVPAACSHARIEVTAVALIRARIAARSGDGTAHTVSTGCGIIDRGLRSSRNTRRKGGACQSCGRPFQDTEPGPGSKAAVSPGFSGW